MLAEHGGVILLLLLHHTYALLELTVPPSTNAFVGSSIVLPCTFRVDKPSINPKYLAIFWHFGETELLKYDNKGTVLSTSRVTIDDQAILQGNASLTIPGVTVSDEGTYKCLVIYSPDRQEKRIRLNIKASPTVKMSRKILMDSKQTVLQCLVTGYYPPDVMVTWLKNGKTLTNSALSTPQRNADGTFRVNSTMSFTPAEVTDQLDIVCQVQHDSLQNPIQDGIKMDGTFPSVQIFSSPVQKDSEQLFMCEVRGLDPTFVKVNWLQNGRDIEMKNISASSALYYSLRPTLNRDLDTNISCVVQDESLSDHISNTIQLKGDGIRQTIRSKEVAAVLLTMAFTAAAVGFVLWFLITKSKYFQRFRVSPLYEPSLWNDDNTITLYCTAFDCVKDVQVIWTVTESDGNKVILRDSQTKSDEENAGLISSDYTVRSDRSEAQGLHNVITTLSFTPNVSKHKDTNVTCKFICDGRSKEKSFKCQYKLEKPEILGPIKLTLCAPGEVLCSVNLSKFYPKDIQIRWSCGVGHYKELNTSKDTITDNKNQTFNVKSECKIPEHLFNEPGFRVQVTWEHESMDKPEKRELSARDTDFSWHPKMAEITKPLHFLNGNEAKFQCKISGYFPNALDVKWLKREVGNQELFAVSHGDQYKIPELEVTRAADSTFTCTASLIIVAVSAQTEQGKEFICRVGHPSLEKPLERSTGPLIIEGVRSISGAERTSAITLDINSYIPEDTVIKWSRAESKPEKYKEISDSHIQQDSHPNSDGSYTISHVCKVMRLTDLVNPSDIYVKAVVEHKILKCTTELNVLRREGKFYLLSEGKEKILLTDKPHMVNKAVTQSAAP
ncbi:uncharacterized protein LOC128642024 [Bombina bombina]|uniref:uncharacterized protein LOC128642024 n=1 Tax=Bombina bombina TaxID=8345 RepID=UPI00235A950C|nr:uncharacterized protein LOC128642024 [Bombina bombina]XP_053550637.1 uncharacterized protein LOC128642024 [Bombina bombina]XP_053550638.1 uncharacterized protein LOC128642024 [Bombina bombina]XP_053550639.1 uncharacterized protein LOC128642024 [Bombina bombina]